ncbi:MAG: hypothetical protein JWM68_3308 [Verrucomicrobiales bacterium]|nr:hypothetical protein [Verrucomicrobiales bacterium]
MQKKTQRAETLAQFSEPITPDMRKYLLEDGFFGGGMAVSCVDWIWCQWLAGGPIDDVRRRVEGVVDRGMEMQDISPLFLGRPSHDLFLLHCAIFASSESQLKKLAGRVVDASGYKQYTPINNGELYESAWCGMLKHWILGDHDKAAQQAQIVWGAYRFPNLRASTKPLVTPWLKQDWKSFVTQQKKDFVKLWESIRKVRGCPIKKESSEEIIVSVDEFHPRQSWCWAHCGMAMLAHREGVQVATDDFWFPPHALKCAPINETTSG